MVSCLVAVESLSYISILKKILRNFESKCYSVVIPCELVGIHQRLEKHTASILNAKYLHRGENLISHTTLLNATVK